MTRTATNKTTKLHAFRLKRSQSAQVEAAVARGEYPNMTAVISQALELLFSQSQPHDKTPAA